MALKVPQSSFSAGELDPVLQERTTLQKFKTGLKTARNWIVGKSGGLITRPGRKHLWKAKENGYAPRGHCPEPGWMIEVGHLYARTYFNDALVGEAAHALTKADLPKIKFETSKFFVYMFVEGKPTLLYKYDTYQFIAEVFPIPAAPLSPPVNAPTGAPTGYEVDYAVSYVQLGEESLANFGVNIGKLPVANSQSNKITATLAASTVQGITEMKVFRRPTNGGAFGYIGSTTYLYVVGGQVKADFVDFGQAADYTQSPVVLIENSHANVPNPINWWSRVGIVYQQRLVLTNFLEKEAILASRVGFQNDFFKDGQITASSALKFRAGSSGYAKVYDLLDADGLVAFTSKGIFLNSGQLGPTNLAMTKKGRWVIKQDVRPLAVPGGVFFVDESTNTVRNLVWSQDLAGYNAQEVSIFSNHLFAKRAVKSWAFQGGSLPVLWAVFDDGTYASFTYEFDQEMRAWTRHDSTVPVREVIETEVADQTYFIVQKGDEYYFEKTVPRYISAVEFSANPEADKGISSAYMDSIKSYTDLINNYSIGLDYWKLTPTVENDWTAPLTLSSNLGTTPLFIPQNYGKIGTIYRVFDETGSVHNLKVIARASDYSVTVQPDTTFPEYLRDSARFYYTTLEVSGLGHLEGESVSILVDGNVIASPNNDIENLPDQVVVGGKITLPEAGAIIHIGRPVPAGDIETLDIDTVEQAPTLVESKTVNKVYVSVFESKGLYIGHRFPPDNHVNTWTDDESRTMQLLEEFSVDYTNEDLIIANRAKPSESRRYEVSLPGDWESNGRIAIRQVDPVHSTILSIIPDVEVLGRSDR